MENMGGATERDAREKLGIGRPIKIVRDAGQRRRIGDQVGIPAEHQQTAGLEDGGAGCDRRFLGLDRVHTISEHAIQHHGVEHIRRKMQCRLLDRRNDVAAFSAPAGHARVDIQRPADDTMAFQISRVAGGIAPAADQKHGSASSNPRKDHAFQVDSVGRERHQELAEQPTEPASERLWYGPPCQPASERLALVRRLDHIRLPTSTSGSRSMLSLSAISRLKRGRARCDTNRPDR